MKHLLLLIILCAWGNTALFAQNKTTNSDTLKIANDTVAVTGRDIVERAMKYIGVPYRRGQMNPKLGFDCSGFTTYVFKKENILLTRSSRTQFAEGVKIKNRKDLQEGDLVFFGGSRSRTTVGHVGIVTEVDEETGAFSFIHAGRRGICISHSTDPYYSKRYVGARRVLA